MASSRAKDGTTWMEMARAMVTQAEATLKAIDARDGDALSQASDGLYTTCETCHDRYMD
jgi:cytochrome c553